MLCITTCGGIITITEDEMCGDANQCSSLCVLPMVHSTNKKNSREDGCNEFLLITSEIPNTKDADETDPEHLLERLINTGTFH